MARRKKAGEGPAVFVQSYGAYNEGSILGEWIDASDPDVLREGVEALMAKYPQYEEWGVFDYQLMPGYKGESVEDAIEWAEWNEEFEDKAGYLDDDAKKAVMEYMADVGADLDDALEAFTGVSGSETDLAYVGPSHTPHVTPRRTLLAMFSLGVVGYGLGAWRKKVVDKKPKR